MAQWSASMAATPGRSPRARPRSRPLREFGSPLADHVRARCPIGTSTLTDPPRSFPHGDRNYWKSSFLRELSDEAIDDAHRGSLHAAPSLETCLLVVEHMGGAISHVAPDATAFAHREAQYNLVIIATGFAAADDDRAYRLGARLPGRLCSRLPRMRSIVNYLGGRRSGSSQGCLRRGHVRPVGRPQADLRSDQPVPVEPEHQTGVAPQSSVIPFPSPGSAGRGVFTNSGSCLRIRHRGHA